MNETGDYAYIVRLIQFLAERFGLQPFITSRDFDVLYHWWEKNIPPFLVEEAISAVVERSRLRRRPLKGFSPFAAEVRKRYKGFLSLQTGSVGRRETPPAEDESVAFLTDFPAELTPLRREFEDYFRSRRSGEPADAGGLADKLLELFAQDGELNNRCEFFLANLAPELRRPDILRTYKLNFLLRRFRIPSLD